jgi:hypothetical protein
MYLVESKKALWMPIWLMNENRSIIIPDRKTISFAEVASRNSPKMAVER